MWTPLDGDEFPSLGWQVIDWITENLAQPDSGLDSRPFQLYPEQEDFVLNFYRLDPATGRRKFRRGVLSRPRGWGKSPFAAALMAVEGLGPVVFDGWDAYGQPVGKPWSTIKTPTIQVAATSEDQAGYTFDALLEMMEGSVVDNYPGTEPLGEQVNLPSGKIRRITSAARSLKGARADFTVCDQALALDTPIPTPSGWTTMGALRTGDVIYGSAGPVRISAAKPVMHDHDCYLVTLADGTSVVASEGHLWHSRRQSWPRKHGSDKVRTTVEMTDKYRYSIPAAPVQEMPEADLPVSPYLLGSWLGDGTRGKCEIAVSQADCEELREILAAEGVETWPRVYARTDGAIPAVNLSFSRHRGFANADRPECAKALSALSCYRDKHVPPEYLRGSVDQRTALLQGLMDSDGSAYKGGHCVFISTEKRLAEAVTDLLRSLGQVTTGAQWKADDRYTGGGRYSVAFTPKRGLVPFRLARKAERVKPTSPNAELWVGIKAIEKVDQVPVRCIAVDSDDHLFAFGESGHLTHNTEEWVPSNGGKKLHQVIDSNAAKRSGSYLETPNAFIPGEGSVAEDSANYWAMIQEGKAIADGLYYDHREAPGDTDATDRESLTLGLRISYGDASQHPDGCLIHEPACPPGHADLESRIQSFWDLTKDPQVARSDYLNQVTHASDSWLSRPELTAVVDVEKIVGPDEPIVVGFDGSRGRAKGIADATAMIGCRVSDGHLFVLDVWEQPRNATSWMVPVADVNARVREVFNDYTVVGFYADPNGWTSQISEWEAKFGKQLTVKARREAPMTYWPKGKDSNVPRLLEELHDAVINEDCSLDGSTALIRHMLNARRRRTRSGYLLYKAYPDSPDKIDAAYAAVMAWKARLDAVSAGAGSQKKQIPARRRTAVIR